jgi:transcriptional antiterminator NusG
MAEQKYRWYVLRSISGKELKVKEILDGEIRNGDLGRYVQQVIVPTEKVITQSGNKKVQKERVLFSGYVFVQCLLVGEVQSRLANTTNVVNFLCGRNSKQPEALHDEEIAAMLGNIDVQAEQEADSELDFLVGEQVKVNDGPFKDFDGVVEECNAEKKKLKVMVKIFGRKTPLELNYNQVNKLA